MGRRLSRQPHRAVNLSPDCPGIYPLIGLAALLAMSGCAAVPLINMASGLMKPPAPTLPDAASTPSPDIIASLAQRMGITLPAPPAAAPVTMPRPPSPAPAPAVAE